MRRIVARRYFFLAVAAAWVFAMALVVQRNLPEVRAPLDLVSEAGEGSAEWMSIYLSGEKIGYIVSVTRETSTGYQAVESSYMRFGLSGTDQDMRTFVRAQSDRDYRMKSFSLEIRSPDQSLRASGEVEGETLRVELDSGGETEMLTFALPEDAYLPFSIGPLIKEKGLKEGDSVRVTLFDPSVFKPSEMWIRHEGKSRIEHGGKAVDAAHLSYEFLGARMDMYLDESGKTLRQEGPMGLLIVEEPKEIASKFADSERPVELITLFSIPAGREITNARSLTYMKVELQGTMPKAVSIENNRQRVVKMSPLTLEIRALGPEALAPREAGGGLERYLSPEALVQSDSPKIKALADSIVLGITDPWEKVKAIEAWVNRNLQKSPTVSIPSALDVLTSRKGDCNEHAVLFAALSRAAGVPATIASGLVYLDGYFYYHAWNRVFLDGWIDMDATFGQEIADATHILLSEGGIEDQASMANIIGRLGIRIVDLK